MKNCYKSNESVKYNNLAPNNNMIENSKKTNNEYIQQYHTFLEG
jgi:hypothetical protein